MADTAEKSISNSIEKLDELTQWLVAWMDEHAVNKSVAYKLRFAMEEIATNAVYYGFPTGTSGTVKARITADSVLPKYSLEILDDGDAFNPLEETPEADTDSALDDRELGGLGVFLVKNLSDDCHYVRTNGWNHLTISIVE